MKNLRYLLSTTLLFAILCVTHVEAKALSIGTAPTHEKLQLDLGETYKGEFTVWNLAESTITYYVNASSFKQIDNQPGSAIYLSSEEDAKNPYSAKKWITIEQEVIELVPNRNVTVGYTITVPEETASGEYNVEIYFSSEAAEQQDITTAYNLLGSGIPILITVGDEWAEGAEILDFHSTKKIYESPSLATLITRIQNLGDTHITPKGDIVLTNIFKKEVGRISFNTANQSILRDQSGIYESDLDLEKYINNGQIVLGPITAKAIILYKHTDPGYSILSATTTFWIIPWKLIIVILLVIMIPYVTLRTKKKKQKKSINPTKRYPR
ncbi:hypothetical protein K8R20_01540 [bacterium]|nr:hypothetical protein [bacterium]